MGEVQLLRDSYLVLFLLFPSKPFVNSDFTKRELVTFMDLLLPNFKMQPKDSIPFAVQPFEGGVFPFKTSLLMDFRP